MHKPFAFFAASILFAGSPEVRAIPSPSIAFRHDTTHVAIVLEDLDKYRHDQLAGLYDVISQRKPMNPRVQGAPSRLVEANLDVWESEFGVPPLDTSWTIHLSAVESVSCTVDEVGVAALSGCQDGLVALCEVSSDSTDAFRAESADHFVVTEPRTVPVQPSNLAVDTTVTASERDAIARKLEALLPDEVARVRRQMAGEYHRQQRQAWVHRWQSVDERLASGEGIVDLDVSKLALGPERSPRFFVRAQWQLGNDVAFLARAWVRIADEVVVEDLSTRASEWLRMREFQNMQLDKTFLGEVVNVVDMDHDGAAEVVFLYFGYEATWISVFAYGEDGPGEQLLSYSSGC